MRDELKAALLVLFLFAILILVLVLYRPLDWTMSPVPVPLRAPSQALDLEEPLPPSRFEQFLARYGPPSFEEQSPHRSIQLPLFTRWLDYEPEHLRVAFVSAESAESDSGKCWVLVSFVDAVRTSPVSPADAARRLKSRRR